MMIMETNLAPVDPNNGIILVEEVAEAQNHGAAAAATALGIREYRKGNWSVVETMVLIKAKKLHDDRRRLTMMNNRNKCKGNKIKGAELRWKWIENYCWNNGCLRSHNQCNDKWDNLLRDYKKVKAYQLSLAPGQPSYWHLPKHLRKQQMLPSNLVLEVCHALCNVVDNTHQSQFQSQSQSQAAALFAAAASLPPPPALPLVAPQLTSSGKDREMQMMLRDSSDTGSGTEHPVCWAVKKRTITRKRGERGARSRSSSSSRGRRRCRSSNSSALAWTWTWKLRKAVVACQDGRNKRHHDLVCLQHRKLHTQEQRTQLTRHAVESLVDAVNKLAHAILQLASQE